MTTLEFSGSVQVPAPSNCVASCSPAGSSFLLALEPVIANYADVLTGTFSMTFGEYEKIFPINQLDQLDFLALSLAEGSQPATLLLGRPPLLEGVSGTFPLAGSAALAFTLESLSAGVVTRFAVSAALQAGDTAANVAARVNAAAFTAGVSVPLASVVAGQVELEGDLPGADQALVITTPNAGAGFPSSSFVVGLGTPLQFSPVFVAVIAAGLLGSDVWIKGGPSTISYVAAGE